MCNEEGCSNNKIKKYGGYCLKHRHKYLIYDNLILYDRFTNKITDYLKKDIQNTILYITIKDRIKLSIDKKYNGVSKEDLFAKLQGYFLKDNSKTNKLVKYLSINSINNIKKVQELLRINRERKLRGEGYMDRCKCNNDVDFYTYENINEIDNRYFFSYKDRESFIWFFDIRSFNKLIEMGQDNPYTRKVIPSDIIEKAKVLTKLLSLDKSDELLSEYHTNLTKKDLIKHKIVDIFSQLEQYGYVCNLDWLTRLNARRLKKLYRSLEDIWNYRLNLSNSMKCMISPPNGLVFNRSISEVESMNDIDDIIDIIINEVLKFNNAINTEYKKLGYMYFLIGLATVSRDCFNEHQGWMVYAL